MTPDKNKTAELSHSQGKPFPWRCPECGKKEVRPATVQHTSQIKHDGRLYTVEVPNLHIPKCGACGELVFDNNADKQIARALREQLGLLSGDQIWKNREDLGLSQRVLAEHLGVAVETISRWENGALTQIQSPAPPRVFQRLLASLPPWAILGHHGCCFERARSPAFLIIIDAPGQNLQADFPPFSLLLHFLRKRPEAVFSESAVKLTIRRWQVACHLVSLTHHPRQLHDFGVP